MKTYLGFTQEAGQAPFVSSHSVKVLTKDSYKVEFYPEWTSKENTLLAPGAKNTMYFQVYAEGQNKDAKRELIGFA